MAELTRWRTEKQQTRKENNNEVVQFNLEPLLEKLLEVSNFTFLQNLKTEIHLLFCVPVVNMPNTSSACDITFTDILE